MVEQYPAIASYKFSEADVDMYDTDQLLGYNAFIKSNSDLIAKTQYLIVETRYVRRFFGCPIHEQKQIADEAIIGLYTTYSCKGRDDYSCPNCYSRGTEGREVLKHLSQNGGCIVYKVGSEADNTIIKTLERACHLHYHYPYGLCLCLHTTISWHELPSGVTIAFITVDRDI